MSSALPNIRPGWRCLQRVGHRQLLVPQSGPASEPCQRPFGASHSWTIRKASSAATPPRRIKPDVDGLRRQPAKVIPDYLTPMPSHLLTTMLSDLELCGAHMNTSQSTGREPHIRTDSTEASESTPVVQSPPVPLPQGHHLVYFPIQAAPSYLAPDGADMDHSPGAHYSRRLWAGGEVVFRGTDGDDPHHGPLVLNGQPWTCTETIGDVRVKESSSTLADHGGGHEKIFVDVWRRYAAGHPAGQESLPWSIEERRTLVFMNPGDDVDAQAVSTPTTPKIIKCKLTTPPDDKDSPKLQSDRASNHLDPHDAAHSVRILPSPRHLFHFSALTFNAHAIHLDPEYARSVDGHRAPLVHGPLALALMLRVLTGFSGQLVSRFVYRNHAPLYVNEPLTVKVRRIPPRTERDGRVPSWDAWVEGPDGGLAVKGTATMAV